MGKARVGSYSNLVRHWYMLFVGAFLLFILLFVYHMRPFRQETTSAQTITTDRNIPNDDSLNYPIEAAMVHLFPERAAEVMDKLEKYKSFPSFIRPIWAWWDARRSWNQAMHAPPKVSDSEKCAAAELPLPILRHMVSTSLNIPDNISHHSIDKPFLYLSTAGSDLCVRAVIPTPPATTTSPYHYLYQPNHSQQLDLGSPWWDSLMVSAQHIATGASFPLHMKPWAGHKILREEWYKRTGMPNKPRFIQDLQSMMRERKSVHIYEAKVNLFDPGRYTFDAKLEYQEGQWNFEKGPVVPYEPQNMAVHPFDTVLAQDPGEEAEHDHSIQSIVRQHMTLPLCTQADLPGRWLPVDALDQDLPRPAALDRHGKFWAPFSCRLRRISYEEYGTCLASKYPGGMDAFGDSNMRRSIKKIITHGRWCDDWHLIDATTLQQSKDKDAKRTEEEQLKYEESIVNHSDNPVNWDYNGEEKQLRSCYCEDFHEPGWNPKWLDAKERKNKVWVGNQTTGIRLRSYKFDGLTYLNEPSWDSVLTGPNATHVFGDIAIFSLGNWDAAYMTAKQFGKELDRLTKLIHQRYRGKQIIYRTPQYYCCRVDKTDRHRLLSGSRVQLFNQLAREKFVQEFQAIVWDTMVLGESRTWDEKVETKDCPSNHASADVVEVENQVLMNALCNGNRSVHI